MENASYIALSRNVALERSIDLAANNIANASTTGYKAQSTLFEEFIQKNPSKVNTFVMVNDYGQYMDTSNGPMQYTENPLDLALQGDGFFSVQTPQGVRYTRDGEFQLNAQGEIVTTQGYLLNTATNAPLVVPQGTENIKVTPDGTVVATSKLQENTIVGQIGLFEFERAQDMVQVGSNLYTAEAQPNQAENTEIVQGALEGSNVEPILEITRLIGMSRAFQNSQQIIVDENERIRKMVQTMSKES